MMSRKLNYLFLLAVYLSLSASNAASSSESSSSSTSKPSIPPSLLSIPGRNTETSLSKIEVSPSKRSFILGSNSDRPAPSRSGENWLALSTQKCLGVLKNPKFLSMIQFGLVGYLIFEIVRAAKDVYQEVMEDFDADSTEASDNALLSPSTARKLVIWLEDDMLGPPPAVPRPWVLALAVNLHCCHSISSRELYRILSTLTKAQASLLNTCLLRPSKIVSFRSIGGLSGIKDSIQDWISTSCKLDAQNPQETTPFDRFVSQGRQGLVLWGPPGCGKSMIMKAIANKSGWPTLVVTPSLLQRKWFGESTNQVRTLFGLVSVLGRCTVVLDELDGLFRVRDQEEIAASRELKTEWLQWWDGAASSNTEKNKVVFVAATNRPWDVDPAVWRRLPQRFYVGVPTWDERCDIVHKVVDMYNLPAIHPSVIEHFADSTEGYTSSDLFQILQCACRKGPMVRKDLEVTTEDIQQALNEIPPTRFSTQYIHQLQNYLGVHNKASSSHNHHHYQQQPPSEISYNPDKPWCWQTPMGNFYEINIPVDSDVFNIMEDYLWKYHEWESSDDDEQYEEESEEEEEGDP